eukprot:gene11844-2382_t
MASVTKFDKPDIFLTMTANPNWLERKGKFTKCVVCVLSKGLTTASTNPDRRKRLLQKKKKHIEQQQTQNSEVRIVAIEMEDESFTVYSILFLPSQEFGLGESDSENGDDRLEDLDESAKTVPLQLLKGKTNEKKKKKKRKTEASCEIRLKSPKTESKGKNGLTKKWNH